MLLGRLVGGHLLLSNVWPYEIIFMNVCVDLTVVTIMLLRDFRAYGIMTADPSGRAV
jgi:hypothetical protein